MTVKLQTLVNDQFKDFDHALQESRLFPLEATGIEILQVNFGMLCNQTCKHCHVEAGPTRTEIVSKETGEIFYTSKEDVEKIIEEESLKEFDEIVNSSKKFFKVNLNTTKETVETFGE